LYDLLHSFDHLFYFFLLLVSALSQLDILFFLLLINQLHFWLPFFISFFLTFLVLFYQIDQKL